ncbi:MATE efflux family protein [Ferroglobus placidus DSM 10642]|uniref:Multidrug-efflux transporter n=1 Tax=Ferroglobus placidus (strain DSM 10642 / AEDII12DO) TaxID=589924 RepID=D3RWS6_FERPA|nr:MATE family efflux transporter [Ferroglobus placidus]ADC64939.1 MATE efflux family protein [Ferroglobus placidus DSM 10642]
METVDILMGDPRKSIPKLSFPIIISNLAFTLYNFADGIWVAGLGAEALSAIGIFFPIFMIFLALSFGLSIGLSSAISRGIGGGKDVNNIANHGVIIGLIISLFLLTTHFKLEEILNLVGAREAVLALALNYGRIIVLASPLLVFNSVFVGILNGEGNTKMTMYANVAGSLVNILLDPVFIYILGLGISGAAFASVASMLISLLILICVFLTKRSFVRITLPEIRLDFRVIFDILRVGIPSSFSMLTMSVSMAILNSLIVKTDIYGVAVFTSAWRVLSFGFIPLFGIAAATTAVTGAAYGGKNVEKLKSALLYAVKLAFTVELGIAAAMILLSGKIAYLFTYSEKSEVIYEELVETLKIMPIFLPFAAFGFVSNSTFQGMGKGERVFVITFLRTVVLQLGLAFLFAFVLGLGFFGIVIGVTLGNVLASFVAFLWVIFTVRSLAHSKF